MGIGMSGMISGLDTDSIVKAMVSGYTTKMETSQKEQTKLQWKMDAWKTLNSKVYSFYSKTMSNLRFSSSFMKKTTSVSDSTIAKITASNTSVNGTQSLAVKQLAKAGYLTGAALNADDPSKKLTKSSTLSELGITEESSFTIGSGDNETTITVDGDTKISELVKMMQDAGVGANFDEANQRFFINASDSGAEADFSLIADTNSGENVLEALGLSKSGRLSDKERKHYEEFVDKFKNKDGTENTEEVNKLSADEKKFYEKAKAYLAQDDYLKAKEEGKLTEEIKKNYDDTKKFIKQYKDGKGSTRIKGQNSIIYLNGAEFTSKDNTLSVNGLTITATETTGLNEDGSLKTVSITTTNDVDGIYDMVRDFLSEYNSLVNEMDKLYNADSSKGYEPLTDDEKKEMSDDEIEKWETKIKDSLLRRDSTVNSVAQMMKSTMQQGIKIGDRTYYLSDFGIGTQSYFSAPDDEKSALHIDGDEEDTVTAGKTDKLRDMITKDPDTVSNFFSQLVTNLYGKLTDKMKGTELSSAYTLYNDKQMQSEYSQYNTKIKDQQKKITYWEEYYYSQFTAMESALARLNSQQSSLSGLLGSS